MRDGKTYRAARKRQAKANGQPWREVALAEVRMPRQEKRRKKGQKFSLIVKAPRITPDQAHSN